MAKSSKKKKQIQDFKKNKIKAGKKKRAENYTPTSFKSKSIYIQEQLTEKESDEIVSSTKHNLSELLSHLNHYSSSFRCRALIGIKEIINQSAKAKSIDPGSFVQKVSKTMMDNDFDVRKNCISVLQLIFAELSETKMSPYFPLVLSHLYCAMSHLSIEVQRDSLKVVELFIKYYPNLVRRHASTKLLQYFLELISTKENSQNSAGRILAMTFALKKESAFQWRIRILTQIYSLLKLSQYSVKARNQKEKIVTWDSGCIAAHLVSMSFEQPQITLANFQKSHVVTSDEPSRKELMNNVIPLLMQCWVEVSACGILPKDAETVQTMVLVLSITYLMCKDLCEEAEDKSAMIEWLRDTYYSSFTKHFFSNFPFEAPELDVNTTSKKRRKLSSDVVKISDFQNINLLTCNLCSLLNTATHVEQEYDLILTCIDYMSDFLSTCVDSSTITDNRFISLLVTCLEKFLPFEPVRDRCDSVWENLYEYCCSRKCSRQSRGRIMLFMIDVYETYFVEQGNPTFRKLLQNLSSHFVAVLLDFSKRATAQNCRFRQRDTLLENLESILHCMQCAFRRRNMTFLNNLSTNFTLLVKTLDDNFSNLFCLSNSNCITCIQFQNATFGCLLPHLSLSEENFQALAAFSSNPEVHQHIITFIIDILQQRMLSVNGMDFTPLDNINFFLRFQLSILLDTPKKDTSDCESSSLTRHDMVCNHVCNSFKTLSKTFPQLWTVLHTFEMKKIRNSAASFERKWIHGLLKLAVIVAQQTVIETDFRSIGAFLSAYLSFLCKQSIKWDDSIKNCAVQLLMLPSVMDSFLSDLLKSDSFSNIHALIVLLEITELRESYVIFSAQLEKYIGMLQKSNEFCSEFRRLKLLVSALCAVA